MKALGLSPAEKEILPASLNSVSTACHLDRLGMLELGGGGVPGHSLTLQRADASLHIQDICKSHKGTEDAGWLAGTYCLVGWSMLDLQG